ncbi:MAG: Hpt domain-containing protein, partial [Hyphomicrobiaceae bacterium]|nr:Hpt domain-containing protein [Hyphomicrobiaceae bacterium]
MTVTRTDVPVDPELLAGFLDEADESLAELEPRFVELETSDDPASSIDTIFRAVHSVKGNSGFFGLGRIKVFSHEMETLLDDLRKGRLGISSTITNVLLAGVD